MRDVFAQDEGLLTESAIPGFFFSDTGSEMFRSAKVLLK